MILFYGGKRICSQFFLLPFPIIFSWKLNTKTNKSYFKFGTATSTTTTSTTTTTTIIKYYWEKSKKKLFWNDFVMRKNRKNYYFFSYSQWKWQFSQHLQSDFFFFFWIRSLTHLIVPYGFFFSLFNISSGDTMTFCVCCVDICNGKPGKKKLDLNHIFSLFFCSLESWIFFLSSAALNKFFFHNHYQCCNWKNFVVLMI